MTSRPRLVFDTNVPVDAVCIDKSYGMQAYEMALKSAEVMMSTASFAELEGVLLRPKFNRYIALHDRLLALAEIRADTVWHEPWCHYRVCRDPTDDKFIDLAVCAGAAAIVTRDADLLLLAPFNGIRIEDAKAFVAAYSPSP